MSVNKSFQMDPIMREHLLMGSKKVMGTMCLNQEFTRVILKEETSMERGVSITLIIGPTKENGLMACFQATESSAGRMGTGMRGSTKTG